MLNRRQKTVAVMDRSNAAATTEIQTSHRKSSDGGGDGSNGGGDVGGAIGESSVIDDSNHVTGIPSNRVAVITSGSFI